MKHRNWIPSMALFAMTASCPAFASAPAFDWNFDSIPSKVTVGGDATIASGVLNLGKTGILTDTTYVQPQGAFTVEARIKISQYGVSTGRWVSDILNTATWSSVNGSNSQGITFRVGGGEGYPLLPENAYKVADNYRADRDWYDNAQRALVSNCLGAFVIGTGFDSWKEVYTTECIDLGKWTYFAAVYDGKDMNVWVNGNNATDTWRVQLPSTSPVRNSKVTLSVGDRTTGTYDPRHLFGKLDFLRVTDSALTADQIREHYRNLPVDSSTDSVVCTRAVRVASPLPGEFVSDSSLFRFHIRPSAGCKDTVLTDTTLAKGDSIEVQVSTTPDFSGDVHTCHLYTLDTLVNGLSLARDTSTANQYVRARLFSDSSINVTKKPVVAARVANATSTSTSVWTGATPVVLSTSRVLAIKSQSSKSSLASARWTGNAFDIASASSVHSMWTKDGKSVAFRTQTISNGVRVIPNQSIPAGIYVIGTSAGYVNALVPVR